jgi:hypothetical protein
MNIEEKQTHVLQAPNGEFDDKTYQGMMELSFAYELPHVSQAAELQNAGTPLYFVHDRPCRRYGRVLDKIANGICGGEKP